MEENDFSSLINITDNKYKNIPVPKKPFEEWIKKFDTFEECMSDPEWKLIYSKYYVFEEDEKKINPNETTEDQENYTHAQQIQEIIKCTNSFTYFCIKYAKISHPIHGIIKFIPYDYQRRVIGNYEKERFNILSKFRQGGLTAISVAWSVWRCLFRTGQKIMVVSKSDREAISAGDVSKTILENLPKWLKPEMDKNNEHEKQFKETNSVLWFYTVEAARGKSITVLIIDEAAFIQDMHKHWKALYPVVSTGGSVVVISTVNGMANWYYDIYTEAQNKKNNFNIIEIDFWEHPEYNNPIWVKDTYANLGEKGWKQEVLRSFLGSGDTWVNSMLILELLELTRENIPIRQAFAKWKNENSSERLMEYNQGAMWLWKEPQDNREYIMGVDCAEGVGNFGDNSCFEIIDSLTSEQVCEFYSNTVDPHTFAQIISQVGRYYNNALVAVEIANQGPAILNALQNDIVYENLFFEEQKMINPGIKPGKTKRSLILQSLQQRLLNKTLIVNSIRFSKELNTFIFNAITKKAEAQKGHHDDAIIALSIALYVKDTLSRNFVPDSGFSENTMKIYKSEVFKEIKEEILKDAPEKWILDDATQDFKPINYYENLKTIRKHNSILAEFGW